MTYGFIDKQGKEVLPPIYEDADDMWYRSMRFAEVLVVSKNGKYGFFDYEGKKLAPLKYGSINDFRSNRVHVYLDGKFGYLDKSGKEIIVPQYETAND